MILSFVEREVGQYVTIRASVAENTDFLVYFSGSKAHVDPVTSCGSAAFFGRCGEREPVMVVPIPERLTLYSLKASEGLPNSLPDGAESFQGYEVLGKLEITDPQQKKDVVIAINRGIAEGGAQSKCFIPRHGLRTETEKSIRDYVFCFQCGNYYDFPRTDGLSDAISKSPQLLLNRLLKNAGVPLDKEQDE